MKHKLTELLQHAVNTLKSTGVIDSSLQPQIIIERSRDDKHGDYASNLALALAKSAKMPPRQLAEQLVAALPSDSAVIKVELAGPGFINFFIDALAQHQVIPRILTEQAHYGLSQVGAGQRVQVEFVSANPTGPLHVGHGRGAAYGSALANLLAAAGYTVHREYYVNDAGRQMDILATSVWLRYLAALGEVFTFPSNGYKGDYVVDIANELLAQAGRDFYQSIATVMADIPADEPDGGDKEEHIDALIAKAKNLLGQGYEYVFAAGLTSILADIKDDLHEFGVDYEEWFSERSLMDDGAVAEALSRLRSAGHLYDKDGAVWFASSSLGDEKDRVVLRENGQYTYFASDIAYHMNKLDRGFDHLINIWGADHHGYIPRVKAALKALGADETKLTVLLVQFATLYRGEEKVQMSTRSGEFVTLRQLRDEVGKDAARFYYVMRRSEQHMDFDLALATSKTNENPVFYVQYAYARVCSVLRQLAEKGWTRDAALGLEHLARLTETHELQLIQTLARYPEVIERAAAQFEPHQVIQYLRELATEFHTYYNAHQFLVDDDALRNARLNLIAAVQQVLGNGLALLSVSTPEVM
ncbi:arginine--tRNA ligase [Methylocucumis oryzae]|uniref:Arginine--tRNA ligase n=1 Tax=Methylocucumis oryzae TaxID=1632867 RepID=A0A0F3IHT9_9GAMM|nr:arginine--tRNA ligase [Methylocucumis oryzae]KJV06316.1 arginine--tRNA ligase [Methylocucumis oryzae]